MDTIGQLLDKMISDCKASDELKKYTPNDEDVAAALHRMLKCGYKPTYDPVAVRALAGWLAADTAGKSRRGLLLYGKPGTGKTYFVTQFCDTRLRQAVWFVDLWKLNGWGECFDEVAYGIYNEGQIRIGPGAAAIDDLGQEPVGMSFGAREEVLERVLCDRYRHWQSCGARTFITSNRSLAELNARYGCRIMDRLGEMCLFVEFTGTSARTES